MAEDNKQLIQIPAEKLVDALLHAKQFEQHYATQESVDNLKEQMNTRFEQVEKTIGDFKASTEQKLAEQKAETNRRFDELKADNRHTNSKIDRLQWFIVAAALALIFKDYVFRVLGA